MNNSDYFRTLFDFLYTSNNRLLNVAADLSEKEYVQKNGFSYGSIRGILTHALDAETLFISRLTGSTAPPVTEESAPSIEALTKRWREQEEETRRYLKQLTDVAVDTPVNFTRRDGSEGSATPWQLLSIVYQHTLQHRSEAAEALTLIGHSPGSMDFSFYLIQQARAAK